jgi:serine/threonine protein kinase/predicted ATPase
MMARPGTVAGFMGGSGTLHKIEAIAHYLIDRELGRGAMGVVYLATDTKLGRPVAIKSLPVDLAADPARRERFEGEARTLASINHPNIGSIFGLEQQDGSTYLVLEYVEGPTLTDLLREGPMSLDDALDVCRQVALGIDAAHQRGVIHRDLKPDNIKIRPDGVVKVLDFGIAMAGEVMRETSATAGTIMAPTPLSTRTGFIVGTPGYMSPEQARGKPVNWSTDLWALGCILYECLTGRSAFGGESLADALASTLLSEPDLSILPPRTPAAVLDLIRHSLRKDLRARSITLAKAADELESAMMHLTAGPARLNVSLVDDGDWPDPPGNLPPSAPQDRADLLPRCASLRASSRLVTLAGPDGCGRSGLALACGHADAPPAGAWWVRLPALPEADLPGLVTAFALGAKGRPGGLAEAVASRIAARHALLILDGCQHAPTACATLVHDLLSACPNLRVLATTRSELGLEGEAVLQVPPLSPQDGQAMVLQRCGQPDVEAPAAALVRRLGGVPLALELAAASTLPLSAVADEIDARARQAGLAATLTPEQALQLVVGWVLDTLPPAEVALVLQASCFVGPFSVRALTAVGGARDSVPRTDSDDPSGGPVTLRESRTLSLLPRVASRGLVRLLGTVDDPAGLRLMLPEPVRRWAWERLGETPMARTAVENAHRAYFLASAQQAAARWDQPGAGAWIARSEDELAEWARAASAPGTDPEPIQALIAAFRALRGL